MECFVATVCERFHALAEPDEEKVDIDEEWGNFTSAVNDAGKEMTSSRLDLVSIKVAHKEKKAGHQLMCTEI